MRHRLGQQRGQSGRRQGELVRSRIREPAERAPHATAALVRRQHSGEPRLRLLAKEARDGVRHLTVVELEHRDGGCGHRECASAMLAGIRARQLVLEQRHLVVAAAGTGPELDGRSGDERERHRVLLGRARQRALGGVDRLEPGHVACS